MKIAERVRTLPPYLFAGIERQIAERKAAGIDVISLGIGDPDLPTPPHIVAALAEARRRPGDAPVPEQPGRARLPRGGGRVLRDALRRAARPGRRDRPAARRQGGHRPHLPRAARPGRRGPGRRPRLPGLRHRPDAGRRRRRARAARARARLPARPRGDPGGDARQGDDDLRQLPQQPDGRRHRGRLLRPPRRLRPRATTSSWCTTTPTPTSPTTATWRPASWRRRGPRTSAWRCSASPRATT